MAVHATKSTQPSPRNQADPNEQALGHVDGFDAHGILPGVILTKVTQRGSRMGGETSIHPAAFDERVVVTGFYVLHPECQSGQPFEGKNR